jgi:hypothetical protein
MRRILTADGRDESGTLAAKAIRHEVVDPKITKHRGRIVRRRDGLLLEFASAVDAVPLARRLPPGSTASQPASADQSLPRFDR